MFLSCFLVLPIFTFCAKFLGHGAYIKRHAGCFIMPFFRIIDFTALYTVWNTIDQMQVVQFLARGAMHVCVCVCVSLDNLNLAKKYTIMMALRCFFTESDDIIFFSLYGSKIILILFCYYKKNILKK